MKKTILIHILFIPALMMATTAYGQTEEKSKTPNPTTWPQSMPIYPGAEMGMINDLNEHLIYPPSEIENNIEGKVFIQFIVEKDGSITNVKIRTGIPDHPAFDAAALEAAKYLKPFTPAMLNKEPVRMEMTIPVFFKL